MRKLASNLPLQDMIRSVIQDATEKLAEEAKTSNKTDKTHATDKTGKSSPTDKTTKTVKTAGIDLEYVEKLASAVDYIAANAHLIEPQQQGVIAQAIEKMALEKSPQGAGKGDTALKLNEKPTPGKQKYKKDKPATEDAAASEAGSKMTSGGHPGGATQLENNMGKAPGQSGGSVPHAEYPEKGPLVNLGKHASVRDFYITALEKSAGDLPPQFAAHAESHEKPVSEKEGKSEKSEKTEKTEKSGKTEKTASLDPAEVARQMILSKLAGIPEKLKEIASQPGAPEYARKRFGSWSAGQAGKGGLKYYGQAARSAARSIVKSAGEDVMKANISAARNANPLAGMGQLESADAEHDLPRQAGGPTGGFGNQGRKHIQSNASAIGYTKRDAKGPVKSQLKEVLDEPALSAKTDSKLNENLRNTGVAKIAQASPGVKIAAARAYLQKIASGGCQCDGQGACQFCKLAEAVSKTSKTAAMAQGGMPPAAMSPAPAPGGGGGGGMGAMAEGDEAPDGCTCGHMGECRVCKLKAALQAANGGGGGLEEKASQMGSDSQTPMGQSIY
ncbi:MAG: hypothetical protein LUQ37_09600 [Methanoregulaceae archaeon]|jgi:hypothetical protein|nr:hypothetical protein [Methanoregulaceae archaeon]